MILLNAAGNGNGPWRLLRQGRNREISNLYTLHTYGVFSGGTVSVEISADEPDHSNTPVEPTNAVPVPDVAITQAGAINLELRTNWIRLVVAGAAGGVSINAKML